MEKWKKDLIVCEFCEHIDEPCTEVQVEVESQPRKKMSSWKCQGYERNENK